MPLATNSDALREQAHNVGMDNSTQAWILTSWDVWVRNPFYRGPSVPHPESDGYYLDEYNQGE